jgi:hypothetical protein
MNQLPFLSTIWGPEMAAAIVGSLVEVALGWYLLTLYFVRKADLTAVIARACDGLDELKKDCAKYWLRSAEELKQPKRTLLEAKIKTGVLAVTSYTIHIRGHYGNVPDDARSKILDLQEACTGGDFETVGRPSNPGRYMRIVNTAHEVQRELHALKLPIWVALGLGKNR